MTLTAFGNVPIIKKTLLIMKLTAILMVATCLQVYAKGTAQITLSEKKAPLEKVLKAIKQQSGYALIYDVALVQKQGKLVDITVNNVPVDKALAIVFQGQTLTFEITNKNIILVKEKGSPKTTDVIIAPQPPPNIDVHGVVKDETGKPVVGASVQVKGTNRGTTTNNDGEFMLAGVDDRAILVFSAVNIETREITVNGKEEINVVAKIKVLKLEDVEITANTGYQKIPKERATGSFTIIGEQLLNQQVSTNLLSRLESITNGLTVDRQTNTAGKIMIRGLSTIRGPRDVLVILDDFPYEGNLDNINPNDVENITILKDAAAASIWGTRAGNGVIVITTKKGKFNQKTKISLNSNVLITTKPDLFRLRWMSPSDFTGLERFLFSKNAYNSTFSNTPWVAVTPVVELLQQQKLGIITQQQADDAIATIGRHDLRSDFQQYMYRPGINLQESVSLQGGSNSMTWNFSGGWDKNSNTLNAIYDRVNLRSGQTFKISRVFELSAGLDYTQSSSASGRPDYNQVRPSIGGVMPPYTLLADNNGNALPVYNQYRKTYTDTAFGGKLLDWNYYPLTDYLHNKNTSRIQAMIYDIGGTAVINRLLSIDVKYRYTRQTTHTEQLYDVDSYFARDLINSYSYKDPATGRINYRVPVGAILDIGDETLNANSLRGQLNFKTKWGLNEVSSIAGSELRESNVTANGYRNYGFDPEIITARQVDYITLYPNIITGSKIAIPSNGYFTDRLNRYVSFYANAAYTWDQKYTISISGRRDASNLFGATSNNKWSPLWSSGLLWDLKKEKFWKSNWGSRANLRITYGASGNADPSRSAVTTIRYNGVSQYTQLPIAILDQYKNPELQWEKVKMFNVGFDYATSNNRIQATVEYYHKNAIDLFGPDPIDYTALQVSSVTKNIGNMVGHGWDISLNTKNATGLIKWSTQLNLNFSYDKVTSSNITNRQASNYATGIGSFLSAIPGLPVYSILCYKWAGLDPLTGDPMSYINGNKSKDYNSLTGPATTVDDLVYMGPMLPTFTASLGNTIEYKNLSISIRLTGKFGHYFMRESVNYSSLFKVFATNSDYSLRWQKPGDENQTFVPSMVYPAVSKRDQFYTASEVLASKADHIRIQYVTLSYNLSKANMQFYVNLNNLGLLWAANKYGIDPEYNRGLPPSMNIALGLKANF